MVLGLIDTLTNPTRGPWPSPSTQSTPSECRRPPVLFLTKAQRDLYGFSRGLPWSNQVPISRQKPLLAADWPPRRLAADSRRLAANYNLPASKLGCLKQFSGFFLEDSRAFWVDPGCSFLLLDASLVIWVSLALFWVVWRSIWGPIWGDAPQPKLKTNLIVFDFVVNYSKTMV